MLFEHTSDIPIYVLVVKGFTLSIHYMDILLHLLLYHLIILSQVIFSNIIYLPCNRLEARLEQSYPLKDTSEGTSTALNDDNEPTDGQQAGRKRWCGECGDESEQERSRTGGGVGRREQRGGDRLPLLGVKEEGSIHYRLAP